MHATQESSALSSGAKYVFWTMVVPTIMTVAFLTLITVVFGLDEHRDEPRSWGTVFLIVGLILAGILGIAFFGAWLSARKTRSFANDAAARYLARFIFALGAADIVLVLWVVSIIEE